MKGNIDYTIEFLDSGTITNKPIGKIKYMDWKKAKKICEEYPWSMICAGLREDWNNTGGLIFNQGNYYKDSDVFGCSRWATPIVDVDGEEIECWTYEETEYNLPTWWGKE